MRGACTLTWALVHADVLPPGAPADVIGWLRTYGEPIRHFVEERLGLLAAAGAAVLILLYVLVRYVF